MLSNVADFSEVDLIACEFCLLEVPLTDALTPETDDYVAHYCGLECYEQWKQQGRDK